MSVQSIGTLVTHTDAVGHYAIDVPIGTYTVTATAFGYYPASVSGVEVLVDTTTTQNLTLTPLPTYVVSGTVTEAGLACPSWLEVEVLNTPIPPVMTDPADGSYEIVRWREDLHPQGDLGAAPPRTAPGGG